MELDLTLAVAALAALAGCGLDAGPLQVELLEDDVAQVVHLDSGRAELIARSRLPAGIREGDVLVDGKKCSPCADELRARVRAQRLGRSLTPKRQR
jgi:hypothetical protein